MYKNQSSICICTILDVFHTYHLTQAPSETDLFDEEFTTRTIMYKLTPLVSMLLGEHSRRLCEHGYDFALYMLTPCRIELRVQ